MAAVLSVREGNLMPGSFSPEDFIDLHHNPFDSVEPDQSQGSVPSYHATNLQQPIDSPVEPSEHHQYLPVSPLEPTEQHHTLDSRPEAPIPQPRTLQSSPLEQQPYQDFTEVEGSHFAGIPTSPSDIDTPEIDLSNVDWTQFSPPALLRKAPTVSSHILRDIVAASIDNVRSRAAEEHRRKNEDAEQRAREEKAASEVRRNQELFLPIIIREDGEPSNTHVEPVDNNVHNLEASVSGSARLSASSPTPSNESIKSKKRKFGIKRFFHRGSDKIEGAASPSTRETLREKLRAKLNSLDLEPSDLLAQQAFSIFGGIGIVLADEPDTLVECVSCLDEFPSKTMVRVPCHHYCSECFVRLVSAAVQNEQQWPAKCCLNPIPFRTVLRAVPDDLKTRFQERSREWNIPISERVYCHSNDCNIWIRPDYINPGIRQGRCENGHWTCTICRGPIHGDNECPEDPDMRLTNSLAEEEGWKRCSHCHALVEHKEACQHMTCRCGHQFCYVCSETWRTCSCTMQQLHDLKEAANDRRRQREFQEQEEADELRRILAQIEEFEREEALRLEQERQEQERLEEERRQRELEERALQESIRRRDVEEKYEQLRQSLVALHELQHVLLESYQEANAIDIDEASKTAKEHLATTQALERSRTSNLIRTKLAAKEAEFDEDFAVRISEERKVEDDYHRQLLEYWEGHDGAAEAIESCMLPLRQRMDEGYRSWQAWKSEELACYQEKLENQKIIQEELMYSARQRLDDQFAERRIYLKKQTVAEGRWLQEIILERERLLGEMEVEEVEGDADSLFAPDNTEAGEGS